jgi:hypothetical protein
MKIFRWSFLVIAVSSACFAQSDIDATGTAAKNLFSALQAVGAYVDCGAGTCGTEASEVQCSSNGDSVNEITYECTLFVQNENGSTQKMTTNQSTSQELYSSLLAAGLQPDCATGTCGVQASLIQTTTSENSAGEAIYLSSITVTTND